MKTAKKLWLSLSAFLLICGLAFVFSPAHKTLAATNDNYIPTTNSEVTNATFKFKDRATIIATFTKKDGTSTDVTYTDSNTSDGNYRYKETGQNKWCGEGDNGGIYFDGKNGAGEIKWDDPRAQSSYKTHIDIDYATFNGNNMTCHNTNPGTFIRPVTNAGSIYSYYTWDKVDLKPNDSAMGTGGLPVTKTLTPTQTYLNKPVGVPRVLVSDSSTCPSVMAAVSSDGKSATVYETNESSFIQKVDDIHTYISSWPSGKCAVGSINFSYESEDFNADYSKIGNRSFSLAGNPPGSGDNSKLVAASESSSGGGNGGQSESACENNAYGMPFAWALCPVLDSASSISSALIGLFEDQLSFRVQDLGNGSSQVQTSWALMRDIASSLLVIIMLIMILSQAISIGPFDAYTIKKLLPKIVIAVIFMQISWSVFSWIVELFDDVGHGLANLMYLPFGGQSQMDIWHLLGNAHLGTFTLTTFDWAAIAVGSFLVKGFLFAMLGTATIAIFSLLAGLFTLVFRKILIIMLLILSPLALVAWILPGTASYWKMWRENFVKALSMFPIAVAIIAAGRIFATVAGSQDNGTLISLIFVLVGYFGPLFILPKTFKWGGQAMQMAGNGIQKASSKLAERPKKYFDKKQEALSHLRQEQSAERVRDYRRGKNLPSWKKPWQINKLGTFAYDKMRSGDWDPGYGFGIKRRGLKMGNKTLIKADDEAGELRRRRQDTVADEAEKADQENVQRTATRTRRQYEEPLAEGTQQYVLNADGSKKFESEFEIDDEGNHVSVPADVAFDATTGRVREGYAEGGIDDEGNPMYWKTKEKVYADKDEFDNDGRLIKEGAHDRSGNLKADFVQAGDGTWRKFAKSSITKDDFWQDVLTGQKRFDYRDYNGNVIDPHDLATKVDKRVALRRMAELGGGTNFRHIERFYDMTMMQDYRNSDDPKKVAEYKARYGDLESHFEKDDMRRFLNDNKDLLLGKLTHLYKGVASTSDSSPEAVAGMHGEEIEAMLSKITTALSKAEASGDAAGIAEHTGRLNRFLSNYLSAVNNGNLSGSLEAGGLRAVKAFLTNNRKMLDAIDFDPEDGRAVIGLDTIKTSARGRVETETASELISRIDDKGGVRKPVASEGGSDVVSSREEGGSPTPSPSPGTTPTAAPGTPSAPGPTPGHEERPDGSVVLTPPTSEGITVRLHDDTISRLGNHIADAVSTSLQEGIRPEGGTTPVTPPPTIVMPSGEERQVPPPTPPPHISQPGDPDFRPPSSSDLPRG